MIKKTISTLKKILGKPVNIRGGLQARRTSLDAVNISTVKSILKSKNFGRTIQLYTTMAERDWQIAGDMGERKANILSSSYTIECNDKKLEEFIKQYLTDVDINNLIIELSSSLMYGFSVVNLFWENKNINNTTYFLPTKFEYCSPLLLQKDDKRDYYLTDNENSKYFLEEHNYKFIFHKHKLDAGDILDYSILSKLIWIFTIKSFIVAQYMSFAENLGVPPLIVNSSAKDKNTISQMFDQIFELRSGSAGIFGENDKISLIEGKGNGELFLKFIRYADSKIAHIVLGGETSNADGNGSYAKDKEQNLIKEVYFKADLKLISKSINNLIKKICDLNFSNTKEYPTFTLILDTKAEQKETSEVIERLYKIGVPLSKTQIQQKFKLKQDIEKNDLIEYKEQNKQINKKEMNSKNKKKPLDNIDVELNSLEDEEIQEQILNELESILNDSSSYEDAIDNLLDKYKNFDLSKLEGMMANYMFNAKITGQIK